MLDINTKGLIKEKDNATLKWENDNFINICFDNKIDIDLMKENNRKTLMFSHFTYENIKTIRNKINSINDLKLIEDILQIYPGEFKQIILDKDIVNIKADDFYSSVFVLSNKYPDVLFICINNRKEK